MGAHHSEASRNSDYSWQVSSLVTTVVEEELVTVLVLPIFFRTPLSYDNHGGRCQQEGQTQKGPMS